ncbi:MAG: hypothetical protein CL484_09640 [Acidobacteria bacterium]|nr:hypothetical protein [Acidobacteriota bacterium]|tara:strand:- start:2730 stop:2981 length:252 start_codon:yes stop_codon:yes gene_type:complete
MVSIPTLNIDRLVQFGIIETSFCLDAIYDDLHSHQNTAEDRIPKSTSYHAVSKNNTHHRGHDNEELKQVYCFLNLLRSSFIAS